MSEFEMSREAWERWYNWIVGKDCKYYENAEIPEESFSTDKPFAALLDKAFPKDETKQPQAHTFVACNCGCGLCVSNYHVDPCLLPASDPVHKQPQAQERRIGDRSIHLWRELYDHALNDFTRAEVFHAFLAAAFSSAPTVEKKNEP